MSAADRARAEAERQGLPPTVEDPAVLAKLAVLLTPRDVEGVPHAA